MAGITWDLRHALRSLRRMVGLGSGIHPQRRPGSARSRAATGVRDSALPRGVAGVCELSAPKQALVAE